MIKLVMVRHGKSLWNKENRFTGWTDIKLCDEGIEEAKNAGKLLKENGYTFDIAYTSYLTRAQDTLNIILNELNMNIDIKKAWQLNERFYGTLQGLNKEETKEKYGEDQVKLWRRSLDVRPPAIDENDERYPGNNPIYKDLNKNDLPLTENLIDTINRVKPYYNNIIKKDLLDNKKIIIVAHGNSLRALITILDKLSDEEVINLEVDTGKPIIYELDDNLNPIRHYYLEQKK